MDVFLVCKLKTRNKFALKWTSKADQFPSWKGRRGENVGVIDLCIQVTMEEAKQFLTEEFSLWEHFISL